MAKNSLNDFSETASENTDIGGVAMIGSAPASNLDDGMRAAAAILAKAVQGTTAINDTWRWRNAEDTTKKFRDSGEKIPTGTTRVEDVEARYQLVERGGTPRLITAYTNTSGTHTHTFDEETRYFRLIAVGGGGGSGGVDGVGAGAGGGTAGGGSGFHGVSPFYPKGSLTTGTVAVGAGGTAGAGTAGDGGNGGDTTWTDSVNGTLRWRGGKGSAGRTATANYAYGNPVAPNTSSADLLGSAPLGSSAVTNNLTITGGVGGSNPWGTGGCPTASAFTAAADAASGTGYGAGASGAATQAVSTNGIGAAGTGGRLEVWEY